MMPVPDKISNLCIMRYLHGTDRSSHKHPHSHHLVNNEDALSMNVGRLKILQMQDFLTHKIY